MILSWWLECMLSWKKLTAGTKNGAPNASNKTILSFSSEIFKLSPKDIPVLINDSLREKEFSEDKLIEYADKKPTGEIAAPRSRRPWP